MNKVICIVGPTASGKSSLGISLARSLASPILSCDSMQVYRGMDIGSAKVSKKEQAMVPHELIDIVPPSVEYTVQDYQNDAREKISFHHKYRRIPFIVGGTGLYFNSVIYDLEMGGTPPNKKLREFYKEKALKHGVASVYEELREIDPPSSEKIDPHNLNRVIRAIEIYRVSGKRMSDINTSFRRPNESINPLILGLNFRDRGILHHLIESRVKIMLEIGLIEEVRSLVDQYGSNHLAFQGIGYKEVIAYFEGQYDFDQMVERIIVHTRQLAKRQIAWFRKIKEVQWIYLDDYSTQDQIIDHSQSLINEFLSKE